MIVLQYFNPQGPRGPRRGEDTLRWMRWSISIHKALAGLDVHPSFSVWTQAISIHKALAGLDGSGVKERAILGRFQSTRPSRASTCSACQNALAASISIHKALAGLDVSPALDTAFLNHISIHKALAGLDSKTIQQSLHIPLTFYALCPPPPPYFNLLHPFTQPIFTAFPLFFRCESPGHFMLAWHSHLV